MVDAESGDNTSRARLQICRSQLKSRVKLKTFDLNHRVFKTKYNLFGTGSSNKSIAR